MDLNQMEKNLSIVFLRLPKTHDYTTTIEWYGSVPFVQDMFEDVETYNYYVITEDFLLERLGDDYKDRLQNGEVVWAEILPHLIDFQVNDIGLDILNNLYQNVWKAPIREKVLPYKFAVYFAHLINAIRQDLQSAGISTDNLDALISETETDSEGNTVAGPRQRIWNAFMQLTIPESEGGPNYDHSYLVANTLEQFIQGLLSKRDLANQIEQTQEPIPFDITQLPTGDEE